MPATASSGGRAVAARRLRRGRGRRHRRRVRRTVLRGFYGGLGRRRSVEASVCPGQAAVRLDDLPDHKSRNCVFAQASMPRSLSLAAIPTGDSSSSHALERTPSSTIPSTRGEPSLHWARRRAHGDPGPARSRGCRRDQRSPGPGQESPRPGICARSCGGVSGWDVLHSVRPATSGGAREAPPRHGATRGAW